MEENIKNKEVIAYKGMKSNMTCRDFQYELGKTYKTNKAKLCECGFHACLNPRDTLNYYFQYEGSRYFKVKLSGEITKCECDDTNVAATEITILEEININEIIKTTEWWTNENVLDLLSWSEGFAKIQRGDYLFNFIDKEGNILSNELFHYVDNFCEGFAGVQRDDKLWNFIDKKGNYLSKEWFRYVYNYHEGFAIVQRDDKLYNFLDKQGNILSNEWFKDVYKLKEGFAQVRKINGEWCRIDKTGIFL